MIAAQGGDPDAVLVPGPQREEVLAERDGVVRDVDALSVGVAAWRLGAGRARKEDPVSPGAGVICRVVAGDVVHAGQPLFEIYADDSAHLDAGRRAIAGAAMIGDEAVTTAAPNWGIMRD